MIALVDSLVKADRISYEADLIGEDGAIIDRAASRQLLEHHRADVARAAQLQAVLGLGTFALCVD